MMNISDINNAKIGVVGAGSWGTALANLLGNKGYKVDFWVFEKEIKEQIETFRENKVFLPDIVLSSNIIPTNNIADAVKEKDLVLIVVPSHVMRDMAVKISGLIGKETILLSASKGIENGTYLTMSGILKECITNICEDNFAVISGPSFAKEVAKNLPTAVTAASKNPDVATFVQLLFATPFFRVYTNDDIIGVELGGAVKNVIAIAAGIIDGLGLGLNTRAALITRGLAEMKRLGLVMGAKPETFTGLAGAGDLVLTCTGDLSRNHMIGKKIGEKKKLKEILSEMRMVAEGVNTTKSVYNLSKKLGVEMPITDQIYSILYEDVSPKEAVLNLMTRDLKQEVDE